MNKADKTIVITLHYSELMYDVQNKTYLTSRSRATGDNYESVSYIQVDDNEENKNQVLRSFNNALSYIYSELARYISSDGVDSNVLMPEEDINIILNMPYNFNEAATRSIASAIHQYLVNTAIGDFFLLTNKDEAPEYFSQAAVNIREMKEAINRRVGVFRRKQSPF
jgi:hypothetical protein